MSMPDLYTLPRMADGYATARPFVHPHIIELAREEMGIRELLPCGLDVGCGAGLSTRALQLLARDCLGIDPSAEMIARCAAVVPGARFQVARAEELPVAAGSIDVITAAGSLNYADLGLFFAEAARVLAPAGVVLVYDFSPGRSFPEGAQLDHWFEQFTKRYPPPVFGNEIDREDLCACGPGLKLASYRTFQFSHAMTPAAYVNYILTETNVAHAIQRGVPEKEIRAWCEQTLAPVFGAVERQILYHGYLACLRSRESATE